MPGPKCLSAPHRAGAVLRNGPAAADNLCFLAAVPHFAVAS